MKAVVLRKTNYLAVLDVPAPEITPDQVLVKMTHCGICGSDVRYLRGDNPWAKQTLGEKHTNPENIILGHEAVGVVDSVGADCDPSLVGKRVALLSFGTCGECFFCKRGEEQLCPNTQHLGHGAGWGKSKYYYGGMAEYIPIFAKWVFPLPDNVTNEAGSLLDPLGVAVHGIKRAGVSGGETVLIIGGGAVGALAIQVAKTKGAKNVVLADISNPVLDIADEMGADYVLNPETDDIAEAVMDASSGLGASAILDTIGAELNDYLHLLARGGTYVTMTVTDKPQVLHTVALAGERTITSSCNFQYPDYHEAISLLEQGKINVAPVITHSFSLAEAIEAFRVAEEKMATGAVKVILENRL